MSVLEKATAQFREKISGELQFVEVPEWGDPDKPLRIYYKPAINFIAQGKILALFKQDKDNEAVLQSLIIKALDVDGNNIFKQTDMQSLLREVDPDVVNRILSEMTSDIEDAEMLKKT
tara:strand:+ start:347 stop:700 length:354 start_codon:yes stop_codon:yes gene_type:complete